MWRIADGGGIEQPDGSFLHQRIHTPDPLRSSDPPRPKRRLTGYNGQSGSLHFVDEDNGLCNTPYLYPIKRNAASTSQRH